MSKVKNKAYKLREMPFVQSYKNHFQCSYGDKQIPLRESSNQTWNFIMGAAQRESMDWRTEMQMAAHVLCAFGKGKTMLWADGSFASQIMVSAFNSTRTDFKCVIPRFKKDINVHSVSQAVMHLESLELPYEFFDMDLDSLLLGSEACEWAMKYGTDRASQIVAMHAWKELAARGHYMVFPFGFSLIEKDQEGWKVIEHEKEYALFQFQKDKQLAGNSCFFKWSPEMVFSYLNEKNIRSIVTNTRMTPVIDELHLKQVLESYFPIVGTHNWHGFEKAVFEIKRFHHALRKDPDFKLNAYAFNYADYVGRLKYHPKPQQGQKPTAAAS